MELVEEVYNLIKYLPKEETYGLSDQMRRAAVSIASNIAKGAGRKTNPDFCHFLVVSRGSKYELETQILICIRLGYIKEEQAQRAFGLCNEIGRLLNGLIKVKAREEKSDLYFLLSTL